MNRNFKVISIFSGAMGLDLGLESTGHYDLLACIEKETAFCDTIKKNKESGRLRENIEIIEADISDVDPKELLQVLNLKPGELDLLVGGPPCQSFSTAGKRRTIQDPRGTLLWQFLRFVSVIKPKFFLMENVRGLLSSALRHRPIAERPERGGPPLEPDEEPGSVVSLFSHDLQCIEGAAYHMDIFEVNAVNYGAPQLRERALFIGNRYNVKVHFPSPTHFGSEPGNRQLDLLEPNANERRQYWKTLREAIGDLSEENPAIMDFSPRKRRYLSLVPEGSNWRSLPEEIQKESMGKAWSAKGGRSGWWRRLTYDLPCPTLVTMPNHASTALCHPTETRALTVKEYARIQEFPDDWEFCGKISQQYAQIGNAVPTRLGRIVGEVIAKSLYDLQQKGWKIFETLPEAYRVIYLQSHVRTRQWFKNGELFVWKEGKRNERVKYSEAKTRKRVTTIKWE